MCLGKYTILILFVIIIFFPFWDDTNSTTRSQETDKTLHHECAKAFLRNIIRCWTICMWYTRIMFLCSKALKAKYYWFKFYLDWILKNSKWIFNIYTISDLYWTITIYLEFPVSIINKLFNICKCMFNLYT